MKKIIPIISLSLLTLAACNKELELLPQQSVEESVVLSTDQNVKRALNGAYDVLSSGWLLGGDIQLYNELLAADAEILWTGTFNQPREVFGKNILTNNSYITNTWLEGFEAINVTNNILSAIDVVLPADQNRIRGEALFIRAVVYFELVKLYALPYSDGNAATNLGLPLVLTPTREINEESFVSRATVAETYEQILEDLNAAEALVPVNNSVYGTKRAVSAYLSRVYLQMQDYANARDAANRAIGYSPTISLQPLSSVFNRDEFGGEDIFVIEVNNQDGANDMHLFWSIPAYGGRDGDVEILAKHLDLYEPNDERGELFYGTPSAGVRSLKWQQQYKNLGIIRLAELFLTRAEGNIRLGTSVGDTPLNDVNRIRQRAGLLPLLTVTLDQVLRERKLELAFEGQGISDAKRLQRTVDGLPYNANRLVLPIPLREMNANPALVQNSGY